MVNPVPIFTPIEKAGNSCINWLPHYLSPFGNRTVAVLEPSAKILNGSQACRQKVLPTTWVTTTLKIIAVFTYVLSAGILPLLAYATQCLMRKNNKFHYITEGDPVCTLPNPNLPRLNASTELKPTGAEPVEQFNNSAVLEQDQLYLEPIIAVDETEGANTSESENTALDFGALLAEPEQLVEQSNDSIAPEPIIADDETKGAATSESENTALDSEAPPAEPEQLVEQSNDSIVPEPVIAGEETEEATGSDNEVFEEPLFDGRLVREWIHSAPDPVEAQNCIEPPVEDPQTTAAPPPDIRVAQETGLINCPVAPIPITQSEGNGKTTEELKQWIRDQIHQEANWGSSNRRANFAISAPVIYLAGGDDSNEVVINCNSLTQEHWLELLEEIPSIHREPPTIPLRKSGGMHYISSKDVHQAFQGDLEITLKQRLAGLAHCWIRAKVPPLEWPNNTRARDTSPDHPFYAIYQNLGTGRNPWAEPVLTGFQELARFLPLIKAFSAQKKELIIQSSIFNEETISINYLIDSVFIIAGELTNLRVCKGYTSLGFQDKNDQSVIRINLEELNSDKIATGADIFWSAYLKAKNRQTTELLNACNGVDFDSRVKYLKAYLNR